MIEAERQATTSDKTPLQQYLYQHKGLQQTPLTIILVIQPNFPIHPHPLQTVVKTPTFEERESGCLPYSGMFSLPSHCGLLPLRTKFGEIMVEERF
jgi:hypothetical protein